MVQEQVLPQTPTIGTKPATHLLAVSLAVGWSADILFYGKSLGISLLVFALLLLVALFGLGWREGIRPKTHNLWLLLPLFFFASMAFIRANPFVTGLNVLATLAILSYIAFFYANGRVTTLGLVDIFWLPVRVGGHSLAQAVPVINEAVDMKRMRDQGQKNVFPLLRGLGLAVPVLLVFTALLTSADLIFADYVQDVLNLDFLPNVVEWIWRVCLILAATWVVAGGLAFAKARQNSDEDQSTLDKAIGAIPRHLGLGFTETITVLTLVDLLFAAFTAVQFTYLFGGRATITLEGYTYAEYARRGFFELLAVAMLSQAMILGLNWITRRESKRQIRWFNGLGTLLVSFVLVMLISAFYRMGLYENTYGYTELRLYVYVFMVWLGILLVWFLLTLWRQPEIFPVGFILVCVGFLTTLNLLNPDAFIARQNLVHYQATGKLDAAYLTTLSDDAVTVLTAVLIEVRADDQEMLVPACAYNDWESYRAATDRVCYGTASDIIETELQNRLQQMEEDTSWQRWQSFHLSRWRAYEVLSANS